MVEVDAGLWEINGQVGEGGRQVVNGMGEGLNYLKGSQRRREVIKWHASCIDKQFMKGGREVVETACETVSQLKFGER